MDKLEIYFTQTIVGMPRRYDLGVPSTPSGEPSWPTAATLASQRHPLLQAAAGCLSKAGQIASALPVAAKRFRMWQWAVVVVVLAAGVLWLGIRIGQSPANPEVATRAASREPVVASESGQAFPIQPANPSAPKTVAIAVENSPFAEASPTPKSVPLPADQPTGSLPASASKALAPAQAQRAGKEADKERASSLLILDGAPKVEDKKSPEVSRSAAPQVAATPKPAAPAGLGVPQPKPDETRVTVVDIAKDGSYVLITNPRTRLPERFTVGQKIFSGETIQKIDAAAGKVQLDQRSVGLQ